MSAGATRGDVTMDYRPSERLNPLPPQDAALKRPMDLDGRFNLDSAGGSALDGRVHAAPDVNADLGRSPSVRSSNNYAGQTSSGDSSLDEPLSSLVPLQKSPQQQRRPFSFAILPVRGNHDQDQTNLKPVESRGQPEMDEHVAQYMTTLAAKEARVIELREQLEGVKLQLRAAEIDVHRYRQQSLEVMERAGILAQHSAKRAQSSSPLRVGELGERPSSPSHMTERVAKAVDSIQMHLMSFMEAAMGTASEKYEAGEFSTLQPAFLQPKQAAQPPQPSRYRRHDGKGSNSSSSGSTPALDCGDREDWGDRGSRGDC